MEQRKMAAVIMVGPVGDTPQEALVSRSVRAAAEDLIRKLHEAGLDRIIVAAPDLDWMPGDLNVIRSLDQGTFHFGTRLADLVEAHALSSVLYFGGASAPLMDNEMLGMLIGLLARAESATGSIPAQIALTNNLHSSDWLAISRPQDALQIIRGAQRDNSLAWMLQENWEYDVRVLSGIRPASSLDLDTPADLAVLRAHAGCTGGLYQVLQDTLLDSIHVGPLIDTVMRGGSRLAILGRVSPLAWQALSKATQCWIRVYSEERGMVASERQARREVQSLISTLLDLLGTEGFFARLSELADAAIIDTRVLMAARGAMPAAADRFASDLFRADWVQDEWLREFTAAAAGASIPVLLGGHGVVSGGLYALSEIIAQRKSANGQLLEI